VVNMWRTFDAADARHRPTDGAPAKRLPTVDG